MRVYVATKLERAEVARTVIEAFRARGHEVTYDWTTHGSVWREGPDRIREVSRAEVKGVTSADVVIVCLPGGRGTHAELGIAIGFGVPVILVSAEDPMTGPDTCAFYHHDAIRAVVGAFHTYPEDARAVVDAAEVVHAKDQTGGWGTVSRAPSRVVTAYHRGARAAFRLASGALRACGLGDAATKVDETAGAYDALASAADRVA